jgi:hypothetical protein
MLVMANQGSNPELAVHMKAIQNHSIFPIVNCTVLADVLMSGALVLYPGKKHSISRMRANWVALTILIHLEKVKNHGLKASIPTI